MVNGSKNTKDYTYSVGDSVIAFLEDMDKRVHIVTGFVEKVHEYEYDIRSESGKLFSGIEPAFIKRFC